MQQKNSNKTIIIACKTLEDELVFAMDKVGISYPIEWIESGLHNTPERLNACLQELLDRIEANRVLLVMGFCGLSLVGIVPRQCELVVPRVDDCISLLIGSMEQRVKLSKELAAYFLTEGWLRGERNLWVEYQYALEKYGPENAKVIAQMMYGEYRTLGLLDTGIKPLDSFVETTKEIAETLELEQKILPASTGFIEQLLTGPWNKDRFVIKAPQEEVELADLGLQ